MKAYNTAPTTHTGLTSAQFRLFPFRSPLLGESRLISIPAGTEMFHFPAWASHCLCIQQWIGGIHRLGFPIRTSSDQRLVGNSPRLNAASHVLHRLDMPRHPPCALKTNTPTPTPKDRSGHSDTTYAKSHNKIKMLASTIQFSHNTTPTPENTQPQQVVYQRMYVPGLE